MLKKKIVLVISFLLFSLVFVNFSYGMITEKVSDENIFQNTPAVIVENKGIEEVEDETSEMSSGRTQNLVVEVLSGVKKGQRYNATYAVSARKDSSFKFDELKVGDKVYLTIDERMEEPLVYVSGIQRHTSLLVLAIIFLLLIVLVGKKQGIKTIISLGVTVAIIFVWALPSIINGASPLWVAIAVSSVITIVTYIIISGFNKKTVAAMLGTVGGLLLSALVVLVFGKIARLSGLNEESMYLYFLPQGTQFDLVEIIFAGIIIGALGACMDIAMSIASSLEEIKKENPTASRSTLFKAGMNIGKDIMGTNTNTLILAYVGSSLTILIVYMAYGMSFSEIADVEVVTEAVLRSLAGSIGLIGVIPLTAFISSLLYSKDDEYEYIEEDEEELEYEEEE